MTLIPIGRGFLMSTMVDGRTVISLVSHGREVVFGKFLSDDERRAFGAVFENALSKAQTVRAGL